MRFGRFLRFGRFGRLGRFMLLDYLFPKQSLQGEEGAWMTEEELRELRIVPRIFETSDLRKRGIRSLDRVFAMSSYHSSPLLKKAIHTFKYRRIPGLALFLQQELQKSVESRFPLSATAVLCPVPLHRFRKFQRGFNQAEMLSRYLSLLSNLPMLLLLRRIRSTGHQTWRGRKERWKALKGAFRPSIRSSLWLRATRDDTSMPMPKHVYLVDDVFTTGATLEECAKTLKAAGAERVEGIVLAYD